MFKEPTFLCVAVAMALLAGCASVPMADKAASSQAKTFSEPSDGSAGLYVYRDSSFGSALKKDIFIDGDCLGQSAPKVFFYEQVPGNREHAISTESEFSPNKIVIPMKSGENYFIRQYIKIGVFVGGANLEVVSAETGKQAISGLEMAVNGQCSK
jgi:hypothetical protein